MPTEQPDVPTSGGQSPPPSGGTASGGQSPPSGAGAPPSGGTGSGGGHDLDTLLRRYAVEADRIARAFGDTHAMHGTDVQALTVIMDADRAGSPVTPVDLAEALSMSTGAVSAVVDRLERSGHVRRSREASDRRRVHLHYTPAAAEAAGRFFGPLGQRAARVRAGFTEAELAAVARYLAAITDAMIEHRQEVDPAPPHRAGRPGGHRPITS